MKNKIDKGAPSVDDIRAQASAQKTFYAKQVDVNDEAHKMLHNEHLVEAKQRTPDLITDPYIYRSGRHPELIEHMGGLLEVRPQYSMEPAGIGGASEGAAEEIESWANAVRWTIEREQGEQTNHLITQEVLNYGYSFALVLPLPQAWRDWPKRDKDEDADDYVKRKNKYIATSPIPVAIWHSSCRTTFPLLNGNKVIKSYNIKKVPAAYVQDRYDIDIPDVNKPNEEIELCEYTDDTWHNVYIWHGRYSETVKTFRHRMPMPEGQAPVTLIEGLTSSDQRPGYRWHGVLAHVADSIKGQDMILSRKMTMIRVFYMPTFDIYLNEPYSEQALNAAQKLRTYTVGGTNYFFPNEKKEINALPAALPDSEQAYEYLNERIDRVLPAALQGIIPGQSSGYEYNLARTNALSRLQPLAERLADGDADIMRLVFLALGGISRITKSETEKVFVRQRTDKGSKALGISWNDVRDMGTLIRAEREASLPPDELADLDAAMKAYQFGLPWSECVKQYLHKPDPERLKQERAAEDIEKAQPLMDYTTNAVMQHLGVLAEQSQGMGPEQVQQVASQGGLPPGLMQAMGMQPQQSMVPQVPPEAAAMMMAGGQGQPPPGPMPQMAAMPPAQPMGPPPVERAKPATGQRTKPTGPRRKGSRPQVPGRSA